MKEKKEEEEEKTKFRQFHLNVTRVAETFFTCYPTHPRLLKQLYTPATLLGTGYAVEYCRQNSPMDIQNTM